MEFENETEVLEPVAEEPVEEVVEEVETEEVAVEEPVAEEPVVEEPTFDEPVAEPAFAEPVAEPAPTCQAPKKCKAKLVVGIILAVAVFATFFVTIYNVKNPSYTYYDSEGAAVAVVEFDGGGDDLISTWNLCAADTMAIDDEAKAQLEAEGKSLIFNDYVVKVSDTKAVIATGAGTADEKDYAVIKMVNTYDEDGNLVETTIDECVENLAIAITSGAYARENNNWILRFFK